MKFFTLSSKDILRFTDISEKDAMYRYLMVSTGFLNVLEPALSPIIFLLALVISAIPNNYQALDFFCDNIISYHQTKEAELTVISPLY